jgi:hypothetical protein
MRAMREVLVPVTGDFQNISDSRGPAKPAAIYGLAANYSTNALGTSILRVTA